MKRLSFILLLSLLELSSFAQNHKLYDYKDYYMAYGMGRYRVDLSGKYYYNENDEVVLNGPVTAYANYTREQVQRTEGLRDVVYYSAKKNMKDGVLDGSYSFRFNNYSEEESVNIDATFRDGKPVNTFTFKVSFFGGVLRREVNVTMDDEGKRSKYHYSTIWKDENEKYCTTYDLLFDDNGGVLSGRASYDGGEEIIKSGFITNSFLGLNGQERPVEQEQTDIIDLYTSGRLDTLSLLEKGYALHQSPFKIGLFLRKFDDRRYSAVIVRGTDPWTQDRTPSFPLGCIEAKDLARVFNLEQSFLQLVRVRLASAEELLKEYSSNYNAVGTYDSENFKLKLNSRETFVHPTEYEKFQTSVKEYDKEKIKAFIKHLIVYGDSYYDSSRWKEWKYEKDNYNTYIQGVPGCFKNIIPDSINVEYIDDHYSVSAASYSFDPKYGAKKWLSTCNVIVSIGGTNLSYETGKRFSFESPVSSVIEDNWNGWREKRRDIEAIDIMLHREYREPYTLINQYSAWYTSKDLDATEDLEESLKNLEEISKLQQNAYEQLEIFKRIRSNNSRLATALIDLNELKQSYLQYMSSIKTQCIPNNYDHTSELKGVIKRQTFLIEKARLILDNKKCLKAIRKQEDQSLDALIDTIKEFL